MRIKVNILRQKGNKGNMGNREYKKIPFWIEGTGNEPKGTATLIISMLY